MKDYQDIFKTVPKKLVDSLLNSLEVIDVYRLKKEVHIDKDAFERISAISKYTSLVDLTEDMIISVLDNYLCNMGKQKNYLDYCHYFYYKYQENKTVNFLKTLKDYNKFSDMMLKYMLRRISNHHFACIGMGNQSSLNDALEQVEYAQYTRHSQYTDDISATDGVNVVTFRLDKDIPINKKEIKLLLKQALESINKYDRQRHHRYYQERK